MNTERPRLLHIISSLKVGGAEAMLVDLVAGLQNQFEQSVIYFHPGPHASSLAALGVPTYHVKGVISLYDPVFLYRLRRLVRTINPQVIHTSLWAAGVLGRWVAKGVPVVSAMHSLAGLDGRLRDHLDKVTMKKAAKIVAVSEGVAQSLYQQPWMPAQKIVVIRNGVDASIICEKAEQDRVMRSKLGIPEHAFIIGSVGRFITTKRYDLLIAAHARLQKLGTSHLVLVGHGPEEDRLRKLVGELGIASSVHFVRNFPAYGYYSLFDCFALPSTREGLSMALLEAMSCGLPVVVTGHNHTHEVVGHNRHGLVIEPGDPEALHQALARLIGNQEEGLAMGVAGAAYVRQELGHERMVIAYAELFKNLLFNKESITYRP